MNMGVTGMQAVGAFSLMYLATESSAFVLNSLSLRMVGIRRARSTHETCRAKVMSREYQRSTFRVAYRRSPISNLLWMSANQEDVIEETQFTGEEGAAEVIHDADQEVDDTAPQDKDMRETDDDEVLDPVAEADDGSEQPDEEEGAKVEGENDAGEEKEEEEKDPAAEIKLKIKDLEKELILEEARLADSQSAASDKGQLGFLKMAATVDNFRKSGAGGTAQYETNARVEVLKALLPTLDAFEATEQSIKLETENEIKFNNSYQSLYRQLKDVYTKSGASNYFAVEGEKYDWMRHEKMSEAHSNEIAVGNVMECLSPGWEINRSIIQRATCVVSLGPEKEEAKEEGNASAEEGEAAGADGERLKDAAVDEGEEEEAPAAA